MFSELIFFCNELENFIYKNQIQEFSDENDDAYYAEQFLGMIHKESLKIPQSEKLKYPKVPWDKMDSFWAKDLTRAYEYIDKKMLYSICAYEIPKIKKELKPN
ncbi:hypothetical protein [Leptospira ilyithenensis]|uniref:DUF86 domain-containing protein n=1 Tax=Leptospira ilyithenensis TaxID=2484901 RepID=A0A4R9LNV2_9LEPT|nr:hypothetical protein [Leptospira ilyithenensis]TGN10445.1 hypothetical protein EHS11_09125 [Leptospira ilyithenensis]